MQITGIVGRDASGAIVINGDLPAHEIKKILVVALQSLDQAPDQRVLFTK